LISGFTFFDGVVIIIFLAAVTGLGFYYAGRGEKNFSEYFLSGRNVGWAAIGFSIFATNISSEHFIGLAGSGASRGLAGGQFELIAVFILIILGWLIAPVYLKSGVVTMPEFLEKRYDRTNRKLFAYFSIIIYIFTKISFSLIAGGLLFYKIFGMGVYTSAILIVLLTGIYSVIGGASAVIRTNVFNAIVLILGALVLTVFGLHAVGGFSGLQEKLPATYFSMFKGISDPDFPWTGIIIGAPILAFWYWCTDQYIIQNVMSAKSIGDARRGTLLAALLKLTPLFILVLPGLIAAALYPEINGDEAFPVLITSSILPTGFKGLVIAGLLAAIMSSLASVFNVTATLFTNDFYKVKHPNASERELVLVGRLATAVIVFTAILSIPMIRIISSQMYIYLQGLQAFISPPIVVIFLMGLLLKKASPKAALWTFIIGETIGVSRLGLEMMVNNGILTSPLFLQISHFNFLHFAIILFGFSLLVFTIVNALAVIETSTAPRLQYSFAESYQELKLDFLNLKNLASHKFNLLFSAFIFLIIIGLWSMWY
jgi:SSS family solute:Na+ symporter